MPSIVLYLLIFVGKAVEVALATLRLMLNGRGERVKGAIIGFFEVIIWVLVVSNVLNDITSDPIKVLVYAVAFVTGNYLGVTLETKLAIGTASIMAVVAEDVKEELAERLRQMGFGVTVVQGQGMHATVYLLMIYLKRKAVPEAVELIQKVSPGTPVTVGDVRQLRGGFIRK